MSATTAIDIARTIVEALDKKKGEDILLLDLTDIASFTDYFVLCTGSSDRMLEALADAALESVRKIHRKRGLREGLAREGWVVVDCGDVVVHLFSADRREHYDLEQLWRAGKVLVRVQ